MLTPEQIIAAKNQWTINLREKTNAKNPDAYVRNREVLLLDDLLDILKGVWTKTTFKNRVKASNTVEQLYLDSKGNIPLQFQLELAACQAYASEKGIDIRSDFEFEDNGDVTVKWDIISVSGEGIKFMDTHKSSYMEWTTTAKIEDDGEIDIDLEKEETES